jgi:hypothetical protein
VSDKPPEEPPRTSTESVPPQREAPGQTTPPEAKPVPAQGEAPGVPTTTAEPKPVPARADAPAAQTTTEATSASTAPQSDTGTTGQTGESGQTGETDTVTPTDSGTIPTGTKGDTGQTGQTGEADTVTYGETGQTGEAETGRTVAAEEDGGQVTATEGETATIGAEGEGAEPGSSGVETEGTEGAEAVEARLAELRREGHGPQRHCDITDQQMKDRLIRPDGSGGLDPETGTTTDKYSGDLHFCGDDSTRVDSKKDYVAAEARLREEAERMIANGEAPHGQDVVRPKMSLQDLYGDDHASRVSGYRLDASDPSGFARSDLQGGTMFATYRKTNDGLKLTTMYPRTKREL